MKKKIFIITLLTLLLLPIGVNAGEKTILGENYETKNFIETLDDEELEKQFSNYQESDEKITIYLFRGKGCSFCRAYLNFMNSITEEYGKYFNMVSFEVWGNEDNWNLMQRVSYYLDEEVSGGVPYIIIGDKVFPGFAESYADGIKSAIVDLYNTDKNERYDILKDVEENGLISIDELEKIYADQTESKDTPNTYEETSSNNSSKSDNSIILWNLLFVSIGTIVVIIFTNYKFNLLKNEIKSKNNLEKKVSKRK